MRHQLPGTAMILLLAATVLPMHEGASAAPPWENLLTFDRVEADPANSYRLSEEDGPWLILACSFSGDNAEEQAHELILELRSRYKMPAFMHDMKFDFTQGVQGRGVDPTGQPLKMRHARADEIHEVAVLVGNFNSVDDPEAQDVLDKLKYSHPRALQVDGGRSTNQTLARYRATQRAFFESLGSSKGEKGPMGHAFIVTNPLLPDEFFRPKGVDEFVAKINSDVEFSLLENRGQYTLQIAHFTGKVITDAKRIAEIENGKSWDNDDYTLDDAAAKAHEMTVALRAKGYDAYEFHDRYASLVCVGSFDSLGNKMPDGTIDLHAPIVQLMNHFKAEAAQAGGMNLGMKPKEILGIPFDIQPIIVEVPRRSLAADYARR